MSEQYHGTILQGFANDVAKTMRVAVHIGESSAATRSNEVGIYWVQPTQARYVYVEPRQIAIRGSAPETGQAHLDRYCSIECVIRGQTQAESLELSDRFIAAMNIALGPVGTSVTDGYAWVIDGPSDGRGGGTDQAVWEEIMNIRVRTRAIVEKYETGNPLNVVVGEVLGVGGIFGTGPKIDENEEKAT